MQFKALLAVLVCAAGCGGSGSSSPGAICDNLNSAVNGLVAKAQPCLGGQTLDLNPFPTQQCATAITKCSDADKAALSGFSDCLNALQTCSTATAQTWVSQAQSCVNKVNSLSTACQNG